ncbi:hypothetical protein HU200_053478 [Digitaria exilis]|uniref:Uncharacterized protein n=1 Tax=Digitaria exilis TaxID=1010633 RepID=A0A835E364_9POAL|nr:hypothetical protein HU200_053478 [Digitaria exilis]
MLLFQLGVGPECEPCKIRGWESKLSRSSSGTLIVDNNTAASDDNVVHDSKKLEEVMVTEVLLPPIPKGSNQGLERSMVMEIEEEQDAAHENEVVKMEEATHSVVHQIDEVGQEVDGNRGAMLVFGEEMTAGLVKED